MFSSSYLQNRGEMPIEILLYMVRQSEMYWYTIHFMEFGTIVALLDSRRPNLNKSLENPFIQYFAELS